MKIYESINLYFLNNEIGNFKLLFEYFDKLNDLFKEIKETDDIIKVITENFKYKEFLLEIEKQYELFYDYIIKSINKPEFKESETDKNIYLNKFLLNEYKDIEEEKYKNFIYNPDIEILNQNLNSTIVIGDIHGDFLTILNILSNYENNEIKNIILLGDIFDPFNNGFNLCYENFKNIDYIKSQYNISFASFCQIILMFGLFYLMFYKNIKIYWVLGNHDINYGFLYFHSLIFYLYGLDHFYNHITNYNILDTKLIIATNIKYNDYYFVHEHLNRVLNNKYVYFYLYKYLLFLFNFQNLKFLKLYPHINNDEIKKINCSILESNLLSGINYNLLSNREKIIKELLYLFNVILLNIEKTKSEYYFYIFYGRDLKDEEIKDKNIIDYLKIKLKDLDNFLYLIISKDKDLKLYDLFEVVKKEIKEDKIIMMKYNNKENCYKLKLLLKEYKTKIFKSFNKEINDFISNENKDIDNELFLSMCENLKSTLFKNLVIYKKLDSNNSKKGKILQTLFINYISEYSKLTKPKEENEINKILEYSLLTNLFIKEKTKEEYEKIKPYLLFIKNNQNEIKNKKDDKIIDIYNINIDIEFSSITNNRQIYGHSNNIFEIEDKIKTNDYLLVSNKLQNLNYKEINVFYNTINLNYELKKADDKQNNISKCLDNTTSYFKINDTQRTYITRIKKNLITCENNILEKIKSELSANKLNNDQLFNIFDSFDVYYFYNCKDKKQYINYENNTVKFLISTQIKNEFLTLRFDKKY